MIFFVNYISNRTKVFKGKNSIKSVNIKFVILNFHWTCISKYCMAV